MSTQLLERPRVALVIPCFNEADRIARVVHALRSQRPHGAEIVFVDNGSTDDTLRRIRALPEVVEGRWRCWSEARVGKFHVMRSAAGRAAAELGASHVGFLDADSAPTDPAWLARTVRLVCDQPDVGFVDSPCRYDEHDAWPCFRRACDAYHDVVDEIAAGPGWFANAAAGFFHAAVLDRFFGAAEPTTELGLRISLLALLMGMGGLHNPGSVTTSARRIVRDPERFGQWCTYSRDFYREKDLNRRDKVDLRRREPVDDLTASQLGVFFERQAVKIASRVLVPREILARQAGAADAPTTNGSGAAASGPDGTPVRIDVATLTTPAWEGFLARIEVSARCAEARSDVERRLVERHRALG